MNEFTLAGESKTASAAFTVYFRTSAGYVPKKKTNQRSLGGNKEKKKPAFVWWVVTSPSCSQCYIWPKIPSVILTQHRQNLTPNNQQLKHDGMLGDFN